MRNRSGVTLALALGSGALALGLVRTPGARAGEAVPPPAAFVDSFTAQTMRVDLFHTGGKGVPETFALDRIVNDGPWAGSMSRPVDPTGLGGYAVEVTEPGSGRLLYSRGYSSLFAEWETTPEAKSAVRTFHESLRIPWPMQKVRVTVRKRDAGGSFRDAGRFDVDPLAPDVNPAPPPKVGSVWTVFENGDPREKVDFLLLGDGYTEREMPKFHEDVKRLVDVLFSYEPWKSRKGDFNVRALDLPAPESGILRPNAKAFRRSPLSLQYGVFGSERYVLTHDNRALREAAAQAPYDALEILANDAQYGGGGIHNDQATVAAGTAWANYIFVHELGHHFAALADEYYTSDVAYETGAAEHPEPWEPNVTAMKDPAKLKWKDLVAPGTPLPTPWSKEAFEKTAKEFQARRKALVASGAAPSAFDALFKEQEKENAKLFAKERWAGKVGAFEGAAYEARGLYRSSADCIMFTRTETGFCPVCRRAISKVIDSLAR